MLCETQGDSSIPVKQTRTSSDPGWSFVIKIFIGEYFIINLGSKYRTKPHFRKETVSELIAK